MVFLVNCQNQEKKEILEIDFSNRKTVPTIPSGNSLRPIKAAVSAMSSPKETFIYYQQLLNYISKKLDTPLIFKQRKTYQEINDLLKKGELDFAFICSGAYVKARENFDLEILVIPIINNEPYYYAYIIVHKDSLISKFGDLFGRSFAFTDSMSNTGMIYPLYLVTKKGFNPEDFFSKFIYTYAHDFSIQAVDRKLVDGASVDNLVFDYFKRNNPEKVADVRIIKKSPPFGIPPVVVNRNLDSQLKNKLRDIFFNMHQEEEGQKLLKKLMIDKFILAQDSHYDSIREMESSVNKRIMKDSVKNNMK